MSSEFGPLVFVDGMLDVGVGTLYSDFTFGSSPCRSVPSSTKFGQELRRRREREIERTNDKGAREKREGRWSQRKIEQIPLDQLSNLFESMKRFISSTVGERAYP